MTTSTGTTQSKIKTPVQIPIHNLDLTSYIKGKTEGDSNYVYKLLGITVNFSFEILNSTIMDWGQALGIMLQR